MFSAGVTARRQNQNTIPASFTLFSVARCWHNTTRIPIFHNLPQAPSPPTPPGHHAIALKHGLHTSGRSESFDIFLFFGHYHYRYHHHQY
jgi:hypothetical protein